jgi:hypothetical protein
LAFNGFSQYIQESTEIVTCLDVGGWTILKWILEGLGWDDVDWIDMAQDRDQWRALVNTVSNLLVP